MMGRIQQSRKQTLLETQKTEQNSRYPWRATTLPHAPHPLNIHHKNCPPSWWKHDTALLFAFIDWLAHLHWVPGQVTCIELAIDFSAFTGLDPVAGAGQTISPIGKAARGIRVLLNLLRKQGDGGINIPLTLFQATPTPDARSLRGIIGSNAIGYDARPVFASSETASILEKQLSVAIIHSEWREHFIPLFTDSSCRRPDGRPRWQCYSDTVTRYLQIVPTTKTTSKNATNTHT